MPFGKNSNTWKKGVGGRKPFKRVLITPRDVAHLSEIAKEHTPEALNMVLSIMRDKKTPATSRLAAAAMIIERGFGKIPQPVEGSLEVRRTLDVTQLTADQRTMLASMLSQARFAGEAKMIEAAPVQDDGGVDDSENVSETQDNDADSEDN